jgi:hypothetical protein
MGELPPQLSAVCTVNSSDVCVGTKATGIFFPDAVVTKVCVGLKLLGVSWVKVCFPVTKEEGEEEAFGFLGWVFFGLVALMVFGFGGRHCSQYSGLEPKVSRTVGAEHCLQMNLKMRV